MSVSFKPINDTPACFATSFGSRFASLQAVLNRSMFSWLTTPAGFGAGAAGSSHSDLDQSDRQMPKRMDALRKKSPMSSLSRSGLSERTEPTPSIVLPRMVRCPHIVAMPFVSLIAGLPFTNSTGDQFHNGSMSMRIRLISAWPTKSNVMPPRGSFPTMDGSGTPYCLMMSSSFITLLLSKPHGMCGWLIVSYIFLLTQDDPALTSFDPTMCVLKFSKSQPTYR